MTSDPELPARDSSRSPGAVPLATHAAKPGAIRYTVANEPGPLNELCTLPLTPKEELPDHVLDVGTLDVVCR
ncbi:MAG: hypothetical protein ACOYM3_04710 [Terrimicrobiaceae bacterium]